MGNTYYVPTDFLTIQDAISVCVGDDEVVCLDSASPFTGAGNKDIDFGGLAITVRSESGIPANCAIDCEGSGRGFYFHLLEGYDSVVSGLTVKNGSAVHGGAVFVVASSPKFLNCWLLDNHSDSNGGAIRSGGGPTATRPMFENCFISGNDADAFGGGVHITNDKCFLYNCIIGNNQAIWWGGGVFITSGGEADIINTVIWGNSAAAASEIDAYGSSCGPILIDYSVMKNGPGDISDIHGKITFGANVLFIDPLLAVDGYQLTAGSPCIGAGTESVVDWDKDFCGGDRIVGKVDIGVCEYQSCGVDENGLVRNLTVRRGVEGPQMLLVWDAPLDVNCIDKIRLVRRAYDYPQDIDDGHNLYEGLPVAGSFVDTVGLEQGKCYYYSMFSREVATGRWITGPSAQVELIAVKSGDYFPLKLFYELLPEVYVVGDKKYETGEGNLPLITQQASDGEWYNLYEDGVTEYGQLRRFLKVFGIEFDYVKRLVEAILGQYDVAEACGDSLYYMAALIGLVLNVELPVNLRREEIRQEVFIYKWKGTEKAILAKARAVSRLPVELRKTCDNVLISNMLDRTSLEFDPAVWADMGTANDTVDYSLGNGYWLRGFILYFTVAAGVGISKEVVEKLTRVMPNYIPACCNYSFIFVDEAYNELYNVETEVAETNWDILEDAKVEEYVYTIGWLYANSKHTLSNSGFGSATRVPAKED